jgi:hypothetical protein
MNPKLDRRTTLVVLGAGLASAQSGPHQAHHTATEAPGVYQPRFFTSDEMALLDHVTELMIPADGRTGGARAARVTDYIDFLAVSSGKAAQQAWKTELAAFATAAQQRYGRPFLKLTEAEQAGLLDSLAANEQQPATAAERFFASIKRAAIFAYYTTKMGLAEELGYQGNQVLGQFPGCPHDAGKHDEKF